MKESPSPQLRRKILLAFDGTTPSRQAAEYLKAVFGKRQDMEIVVCCVARRPPAHLLTPGGARQEILREELLSKVVETNLSEAQKWARRGLEILKETFPEKSLEIRVTLQQGDLAYEIIREAHAGKYDAIVVGRRGLSRLTQGFMGSVSFKLAEHARLPVWMVAGKAWNKKVLVAVDLGEPGFRVVDHVAFIFEKDPEIELTLLHVVHPFGLSQRTESLREVEVRLERKEEEESRQFFEKARQMFEENGWPLERVRVKIVRSIFGPASAILKEARRGGYSTVVVGRRGRGGFKGLLLGSVSAKIIATLKDRTVWLVS